MTNRLFVRITFAFLLLLSACATTPDFDTTNADLSVAPQQAANELPLLKGKVVIWGGIIVNSQNLKNETQFEVLAYPLDSDQEPNIDKKPIGRFLAVQEGYIETTDYSQGRTVTIKGTLKETRMGRIGETEYTYPTILLDRIFLWPRRSERTQTRFHIGIGVMFHD